MAKASETERGKMVLVPGYKGVYHWVSNTRPKYNGKSDECFYISYKDRDGKKKWLKIGWASEGASPKLAEMYRADFIKSIRFGTPPPTIKIGKGTTESETTTVEDFWYQKYTPWKEGQVSGFRNIRGHFVNWIQGHLGHLPLDQVTREHIDTWLNFVRGSKIADQTKKHIELTCREIFEKAMDYEVITASPFRGVKLTKVEEGSNGRVEFFSDEQIGDILEEVKKNINLHIYTLLALFHGLRRKEVINIRWRDLDLERGRLILRATKKREKDVIINLSDPVMQVLNELLRRKPDHRLLPTWNNPDQITSEFKKVIDKLGFNVNATCRKDTLVPHSLRHTFASMLLDDPTVAPKTAKELTRHRTWEQFNRYVHVKEEKKAAAINGLVNRLADKVKGQED